MSRPTQHEEGCTGNFYPSVPTLCTCGFTHHRPQCPRKYYDANPINHSACSCWTHSSTCQNPSMPVVSGQSGNCAYCSGRSSTTATTSTPTQNGGSSSTAKSLAKKPDGIRPRKNAERQAYHRLTHGVHRQLTSQGLI